MTIEPLDDRVIVYPLDEEGEKKIGNIIIPEIGREKPTLGEVVACGPGKPVDGGKIRPLTVRVGDIVCYGKYSGSEIEIDDRKVLFMREADIMGIMRDLEG